MRTDLPADVEPPDDDTDDARSNGLQRHFRRLPLGRRMPINLAADRDRDCWGRGNPRERCVIIPRCRAAGRWDVECVRIRMCGHRRKTGH